MSSYLQDSPIKAPATAGLNQSPNDNFPTTFTALAYRHSQGKTYFACMGARLTWDVDAGVWSHVNLVSSVKGKRLPEKLDAEVWAISLQEYQRLVAAEREWWSHVDRLQKGPNKLGLRQACQRAHDKVRNERL